MYKYYEDNINKAYNYAKEVYASYGIDTEKVLNKMKEFKISLHCWQGDDVTGFENQANGLSGGGIMATGNYMGKARNGEELRADLEKAMSLIPGKHKVNIHAIYAETDGKKVDRNELSADHFSKWIEWAKQNQIGLDFNPSYFSHSYASSGLTLSSRDEKIRRFWIEHGKRSREIAAEMGKQLGMPCVNNIWIPDGSKEVPANRMEYRKILKESLDEILHEDFDNKYLVDAVESKLFGIGSESYVVGSHEFYMGYALHKDIALCLDAGHFHPTESIADKISSMLLYCKELLLHVSRGVRWDSDHVVILNDEILAIAQEVKRCDAFKRIYYALDFFDASINRITAWVTGTRAALKSILIALLEPSHLIWEAEIENRLGDRLALNEEFKSLPYSAVWDKYCLDMRVPVGAAWIEQVREYEEKILSKR